MDPDTLNCWAPPKTSRSLQVLVTTAAEVAGIGRAETQGMARAFAAREGDRHAPVASSAVPTCACNGGKHAERRQILARTLDRRGTEFLARVQQQARAQEFS
jgi:hypothetical protein